VSDRIDRQSQSRADQLRKQRQPISSRVPVMPVKKEVPEQFRQPVTNPFGKSAPKSVPQPVTKRAAVVTTRSTPYSTPLRQSVATPVRRKVYRVAANGVETRFPSLPMIRFSWQWVSGFMTVVFLTLVLLMIYLPVFEVSQIQVEGIQRVPLEEVQAVIQNATDSIFAIDTQKVVKAVGLAYPELADISLKVEMSGALKMTVRERQPIIEWKAGDYTFWIDADGVLMTPRGDGGPLMIIQSDCGIPLTKPVKQITSAIDYANLLLERKITPVNPEDLINTINPVVLKAAVDLNSQMPSGAVLVYDSISGMGWADPRGWKVYFGLSLENIQFKQVEYQAIVDRLTEIGVSPSTISVEHIDSPYYRTE
jgi:hypothetical protein